MSIKAIKLNNAKKRLKVAKLVGNQSRSAIYTFKDMHMHFKKHGWGLSYHFYQEMSQLKGELFDALLKFKGYTVKLDEYGVLVICLPK